MNSTDKSSIYISIFKRKGSEGLNTKIIKEASLIHIQEGLRVILSLKKCILVARL